MKAKEPAAQLIQELALLRLHAPVAQGEQPVLVVPALNVPAAQATQGLEVLGAKRP